MHPMSLSTYVSVIAMVYFGIAAIRKWHRTRKRRSLTFLPGPPQEKWSKGHIPSLYNPNTAFQFHDSLGQYGPVAKIYGVFGSVRLYINDPYVMGEILLKEQNGFERTESYVANLNMILGPGLLGSKGVKHKAQRKLLTPLFNSTTLREKLPIFQAISHKLVAGIEHEIKEQGAEVANIDMFEWAHRSALDAVGQGGMGHDFQTLSGVDSEYSRAIQHLLPALFSLVILRPIMPTLYKIGPAWFRRAVITRVPSKAIKQLVSIVDVQHEQALQIFEQKKAALAYNHSAEGSGITEKDVVTLMLQANEKASAEEKISEEEMLGQLNTLIFAGHDTTSGALACIFQMLAEHPSIQEDLRNEVLQCSLEDPDYTTLEAFPLLEAVIKETLRLHPPVSVVERVASRDTVIPLRVPTTDKNPSTELAVPAGTLVMLSLRAANRDQNTWGSDALEWDPYRWLKPLPTQVADARVPGVYSNLMSFLGGSNSCIAYKFALLETKVVVAAIVRRFRLSPGDQGIVWKFGGTSKPFVVDPMSGRSTPGLVLKLAAV
ncbi:cytochrome P450 [Ceratobasidium sp. AG-I]|nr:cytochrome P450 [Ceratobasidium sp. AG-I]